MLLSSAVVLAGNLDSPAGPADPEHQMHTLAQIYDRLTTGAAPTKMTMFTHPGSGPTTATGRTLDEVWAVAKPWPWAPRVNKTGQTECYQSVSPWETCTCGTADCPPGQDGFYQMGIDPALAQQYPDTDAYNTPAWMGVRFTDNGDGTVADNVTGLIWLKDASCSTLAGTNENGQVDWATALSAAYGLADETCGFADSSSARDWRLPNIHELHSLIDPTQSTPALPSGHPFDGTLSYNYWSSTTAETNSASAWLMAMGYDGVGNLSGYAWGTNFGWINFNPSHSQVTVDPVSGHFDGYAWGENVGWIHFSGTAQDSTAYKVNTLWRGDLTGAYQNDIAAIITSRRPGPASSAGLTIANGTDSFLNDAGDGIIFGHNSADFANVTGNLGTCEAAKRWARIWQLDVNDGASASGGQVDLTFDISDAGGQGNFDETGTYFLLKRPAGSSDAFTTVSVADITVSGDQLTFTVDAGNLGSELTLGATEDSPTAVGVQSFAAVGEGWLVGGLLGLGGLLALGVTVLVLGRRRRYH